MAENLTKKPAKGILKHSKSLEQHDINKQQDIKWDEMNILQTLHPPDKDYGHMKIDEPKTPYSYYNEENPNLSIDNEKLALDPSLLAERIQEGAEKLPKVLAEESSSSEEDETETEEEKAKRKLFEYKRKMHYNEFYAVKLARKLMSNDEEDEEEDDDKDDEEETNDRNTEISEQPLSEAKHNDCAD